MRNNNRIRTYPIKSLCIFAGIAFIVSLAMVIGFIFYQSELMVIRVLVWIFCGLFTVASGIVLVYQLFFYIEVTDKYFIKHAMLTKYKFPFEIIQKVTNEDGFYSVYIKGRKIASFATNTKEASQILISLEKHGVKISW